MGKILLADKTFDNNYNFRILVPLVGEENNITMSRYITL